jgi:hypothetical protein
VQAVSQAIADVEKMEQEEHANKKALFEAKSLSHSKVVDEKRKVTEDMLENVQMLMEMPVVVENSGQEPQTVAEVIEVPAQGSGTTDTDIVIVDGSMLLGQEEVPPDTQCQVLEVVLDEKNSDGSKQDIVSEVAEPLDHHDAVKDSGEKNITLGDKVVTVQDQQWDSVGENKQDDSVDKCSPAVTDKNETVIEEAVINKHFGMDEGSRIEVVAIEIPTSKAEEKEINKKDNLEEPNKEKVQIVKKDEDEVVVVEKKQDTPEVEAAECDKAMYDGDQKVLAVTYTATKELTTSEDAALDSCETKKEAVTSDVEKEVNKENGENIVEENGKGEKDVAVVGVEEENLPAPEPPDGNVDGMKKEAKKQETEAEDLITEVCEVTEKISEVTEEEDSHVESSEDEKKVDDKSWTVAERGEEPISENTRCSIFVFLVLSCDIFNLNGLES